MKKSMENKNLEEKLNEIKKRKTDITKKSPKVPQRNSDRVKKNDIIEIPIYDEDNKMIRAFKEFVNEQKVTLQEMVDSGFFKEMEAYNIIYSLKKPYKKNSDKKVKPQFSWMRAERLLDYFGYDVEFIFTPIDE